MLEFGIALIAFALGGIAAGVLYSQTEQHAHRATQCPKCDDLWNRAEAYGRRLGYRESYETAKSLVDERSWRELAYREGFEAGVASERAPRFDAKRSITPGVTAGGGEGWVPENLAKLDADLAAVGPIELRYRSTPPTVLTVLDTIEGAPPDYRFSTNHEGLQGWTPEPALRVDYRAWGVAPPTDDQLIAELEHSGVDSLFRGNVQRERDEARRRLGLEPLGDEPRLDAGLRSYVVAATADGQHVLLGGLGAFGVGAMWFPYQELYETYPGWAERETRAYSIVPLPASEYDEQPFMRRDVE